MNEFAEVDTKVYNSMGYFEKSCGCDRRGFRDRTGAL
jgi:hypothetical protein